MIGYFKLCHVQCTFQFTDQGMILFRVRVGPGQPLEERAQSTLAVRRSQVERMSAPRKVRVLDAIEQRIQARPPKTAPVLDVPWIDEQRDGMAAFSCQLSGAAARNGRIVDGERLAATTHCLGKWHESFAGL